MQLWLQTSTSGVKKVPSTVRTLRRLTSRQQDRGRPTRDCPRTGKIVATDSCMPTDSNSQLVASQHLESLSALQPLTLGKFHGKTAQSHLF